MKKSVKNEWTWDHVQNMSEEAYKKGDYQNDFRGRTPGCWPIKVENYKGEYLATWTHTKWKTEMYELMKLIQLVLEGKILPRWEMIPYRSEKDFRGGIFSDFSDLWLPIIHCLPTEREKTLTYKLIHEGLSFTDNQARIKIKDAKLFRKTTLLVTEDDKNATYNDLVKKGIPKIIDKNGEEWIRMGGVNFPLRLRYPKELTKNRNGVWHIKPFYQTNQAKILDNPTEIQNQIVKWVRQGVMNYLGRANEIKSKMRTSLVLAYNENKDAYRICFDGGAGKETQAFSVPCELDTVGMALKALEKGDLLCKLDDKSGFLQVKFSDETQKLSHCVWGDHVFEFYGAIFGMARVPGDFQMVNNCAVNFLRKQGIDIFLYLDDRLVIEKNVGPYELKLIQAGKIAPRAAWLTHALITALGGYISKKKSTFVCSTELDFLGFEINTEKQTVKIPEAKWNKLQTNIQLILDTKKVNFKHLEKLRGYMCSFMIVVHNMRLYIRRVTETLVEMEKEDLIETSLTERLKSELEVWQNKELEVIKTERPWIMKTPLNVNLLVDTDASGFSAGWIDPFGVERTIAWTPEEATQNIAVKEALAILKYLEEFGDILANKRVNFLCDNKAVVASFEQGAREAKLNDVIRQINLMLIKLNIVGKIEWVGTKEQKADKASRTIDIREEILREDVYQTLKNKCPYPIKLDGMATYTNKKEKRYISRLPESRSFGTDIFKVNITEPVYLFPPLKISEIVFRNAIKQNYKFLGIFHVYQTWPAWISALPNKAKIIPLDEKFLKMNNLKTDVKTCSLIPSKKRVANYGYFNETKKTVSLYAVIVG